MCKKEEITTRKAKISDMAIVHELVKELAVYEKAGSEVSTKVSDYEKGLQGGLFEVIVAEWDHVIIGMVFYYMTYSTWKGKMLYLEDFVVKDAYRRFGAGQILFDALLAEARRKEAVLVKWQVLDWNEPAISFYEKNKATIEKDWWTCKVFLE